MSSKAAYEKLDKLGEGTFAVVHRARNIETKQLVAIKKIKLGHVKDGIDMSAIREVKFLQELDHPNIIKLMDLYTHKKTMCLVLEFLSADLEQLIKAKHVVFMPADIKSWTLMTLRGLEHCHRSWILHRDIKPNNLLIAADGQLKLADFGLAREYASPDGNMTSQVVTRWYRAPELLFGAKDYGAGVDIWAVGCIFAELMLRTPFLPGDTDVHQITTIFRARGTPNEAEWPGMTKLPDYVEIASYPPSDARKLFIAASDDALDLLSKLLAYNPVTRISAYEALCHDYFKNSPRPTNPGSLPRKDAQDNKSTAPEVGHLDALPPPNLKKRKLEEKIKIPF